MEKKHEKEQEQENEQERGAGQEHNFDYDRYLTLFLKKNKINICICSYKNGNVFTLGTTYNKESSTTVVSLWITHADRPLALCYNEKEQSLYLGTRNKLIQYYNEGTTDTDIEKFDDFDTTFTERRYNILNDIDIHDIALDDKNEVYFVSALFCCVCTRSDNSSMKVYWKPPWITRVVAEDRCHLNGLCCVDNKPRYVTALSRTNRRTGWRNHKADGGVVYDIVENKLICKGLSMPHSPTFYNGKLWILESGAGYLGYIDMDTPITSDHETYYKFEKLLFIPGFIRGISFINKKFCIVGSSHDRYDQMFENLPLKDNLKKEGSETTCGIYIIDVESKAIVHHFLFTEGPVTEIYDVKHINNCVRGKISEFSDNNSIDYRVTY